MIINESSIGSVDVSFKLCFEWNESGVDKMFRFSWMKHRLSWRPIAVLIGSRRHQFTPSILRIPIGWFHPLICVRPSAQCSMRVSLRPPFVWWQSIRFIPSSICRWFHPTSIAKLSHLKKNCLSYFILFFCWIFLWFIDGFRLIFVSGFYRFCSADFYLDLLGIFYQFSLLISIDLQVVFGRNFKSICDVFGWNWFSFWLNSNVNFLNTFWSIFFLFLVDFGSVLG